MVEPGHSRVGATRCGRDLGVSVIIQLSADSSDNSEYFTRDDEILFRGDFDYDRAVPNSGPVPTGLIGRITGCEMMNKIR